MCSLRVSVRAPFVLRFLFNPATRTRCVIPPLFNLGAENSVSRLQFRDYYELWFKNGFKPPIDVRMTSAADQ